MGDERNMVSIITSVYNCENYVSEMIDSILRQTYSSWELIIFDDASTDRTWEILNSYHDKRIKKYRNTQNIGLTRNLNKGIKISKGEYIARIDGDDIAYPNRLQVQVDYMNMHPDIDLLGCWMQTFGNSKTIAQSNIDKEKNKINLLFSTVLFHPTFLIRKSTLENHHITYNEKLKYAQDYGLEYEISNVGQISNISNILLKYRVHDEQITSKKGLEQIECANIVRKQILKDLNIEISNDDFNAWEKFCTLSVHDKESHEVVKKIVNLIIINNRIYKKYNQDMLERILFSRLLRYEEKILGYYSTDKNEKKYIKAYDAMYMFMLRWMEFITMGLSLDNYLLKRGINEVAIYGGGHIGRMLYLQLKKTDVKVLFCIDQNMENNYISADLPIYNTYENIPKINAIIVTPFYCFEQIKAQLKVPDNCKILSIENMIEDAINNEY